MSSLLLLPFYVIGAWAGWRAMSALFAYLDRRKAEKTARMRDVTPRH